ncbi:hypothetical protein [Caldalkalibacillus salinus]|uniref:hypothetical protein n=1 Tax=Caldalkalibacillus salinus TaxID=2803787 RepID=UPI001922B433|nr:hypothetical protein [Caldalkalibacillus salinus]
MPNISRLRTYLRHIPKEDNNFLLHRYVLIILLMTYSAMALMGLSPIQAQEITSRATETSQNTALIKDVSVTKAKDNTYKIRGWVSADVHTLYYTLDDGHDILLADKITDLQQTSSTHEHDSGYPFTYEVHFSENVINTSNLTFNLVLSPSEEGFNSPDQYVHVTMPKSSPQ